MTNRIGSRVRVKQGYSRPVFSEEIGITGVIISSDGKHYLERTFLDDELEPLVEVLVGPPRPEIDAFSKTMAEANETMTRAILGVPSELAGCQAELMHTKTQLEIVKATLATATEALEESNAFRGTLKTERDAERARANALADECTDLKGLLDARAVLRAREERVRTTTGNAGMLTASLHERGRR